MKCSRCGGLLVTQWDVDLRIEEWRCAICSFRPAYAEPKPTPENDNRGRYEHESSVHICKCGHPKVPWRSSCRDCLDRWVERDRKYIKREKTRAVNATRKAMS